MDLPIEEKKQIENEMLFRRVNEKLGKDLDDIDQGHRLAGNPQLVRDDDEMLEFQCECSDENCNTLIKMRLSLYKFIHGDRSTFIVKPNHEVTPIERVLESNETFTIVMKNNTTPEPLPNAQMNDTTIDNSRK